MPNPNPKLALSLTHDRLCVLSIDTWWNFGHECPCSHHCSRERQATNDNQPRPHPYLTQSIIVGTREECSKGS